MTPFCVLNTTKNALQIMSLAAYAIETNKRHEGGERGKDVSIFLCSFRSEIRPQVGFKYDCQEDLSVVMYDTMDTLRQLS